MADCSFYVQIVPAFAEYTDGSIRLESLRATKVTQGRPGKLDENALVVKLNLDLPDGMFDPPELNISVPEDAVLDMSKIEVDLVDMLDDLKTA